MFFKMTQGDLVIVLVVSYNLSRLTNLRIIIKSNFISMRFKKSAELIVPERGRSKLNTR